MKAIFVAGTDTGVGKSVITGLLGSHMLRKGRRVVTQKWVETGAAAYSRDIELHLKLMAKRKISFPGHLSSMSPYVFRLASSPYLAARAENKKISIGRIKRCFKELSFDFDRVIVEGAGGLLVPVNKDALVIDIVKEMRLPVLLVAANRLGAINSTLLSIEALRSRDIKIIGVVFNNVLKDEDERILKDNPAAVKAFGDVSILGVLPYSKKIEFLRNPFARIARRIEERL